MWNLDGILIRECLELQETHKQRLIEILQDSLRPERTIDKRFNVLLDIATELCGTGITARTHEQYSSLGRNMIAYQLRQEGYSLIRIGKMLGRNHSSVLAMERRMKDVLAFPHIMPHENEIWNEFQKRLKEHDEKCM